MTDRIPVDGLPLALVADDREERTRWLARLLEEAGYAVLRERTARHALERGRTAQPDLIIIGGDLPDMPGIELCRELRGDARLTHGTPIFLAPPEPLTRERRLCPPPRGAPGGPWPPPPPRGGGAQAERPRRRRARRGAGP